jgi:small subunit ribosomal protein S1
VDKPEEVVKVGDEIEVKVLRVDVADRKIGLSRRPSAEAGEAEAAEAGPRAGRGPRKELRGGTGAGGGQLFSMPGGEAGSDNGD